MKRFVEGADRRQSTLFPECLEDWIGERSSDSGYRQRGGQDCHNDAPHRDCSTSGLCIEHLTPRFVAYGSLVKGDGFCTIPHRQIA